MVINALDPFFGGHESRLFARQIYSRAPAETKAHGVVGNFVDAEPLSDVVEKNVAGIHDGFVETYFSMSLGFPAVERASIEAGVTRAIDAVAFGHRFRFEHGGGHDDFKDGAGSELCLDGAIEQRRLFIGVQLGPLLLLDAHGEIVGIECGAADHGENFAGARVQSDYRALLIGHVGFRDGLQIVINSELNGLARDGFDVVERTHHFADAVHDHAALAVFAFELFVIFAFESGLADEVARAIVAVAIFELLRRDFTHVADGAREHGVMRVTAALDHH